MCLHNLLKVRIRALVQMMHCWQFDYSQDILPGLLQLAIMYDMPQLEKIFIESLCIR